MTLPFSDFEVGEGETFGDWLYAQVAENAHIENVGFMPDRVRSVTERLQAGRPEHLRLTTVVPWLRSFTAFTAPGRYIYFSRKLLEHCPTEETAAFVIAHEIAHHDLGHLALFTGPFARHAARLDAGRLAVLFFRMLQRRIYRPDWELDADRRGLDLCHQAGFDLDKCVHVFHILKTHALYHGDHGAVYGLDTESDQELSAEAGLMTKARIWLYTRQRGYLPIQDRRAELVRHAKEQHGLSIG